MTVHAFCGYFKKAASACHVPFLLLVFLINGRGSLALFNGINVTQHLAVVFWALHTLSRVSHCVHIVPKLNT